MLNYCTFIFVPLTQNGGTALFIACQEGHSDVVNILIRNGADVNLACQVYMKLYYTCVPLAYTQPYITGKEAY